MASLTDILISETYRQAQRSGVNVTVETNITPKLTVYDAASTGPSLLDLLGIRAHVVVQTDNGQTLAEYGEPPGKNFLLGGAYAAVLILGVVAIGATVARFLR